MPQEHRRSSGYSDLPTCEDTLGMEGKYGGLAKFICECETPMTIAINGDWGSGKSSAMKIIQEHLKKQSGEAVTKQIIEFNTWEFSIVNDNSKLVFELLQTLNEHLQTLEEEYAPGTHSEETGRLLSFFSVAGNALKDLAVSVIDESEAKHLFNVFKGFNERRSCGEEPGERFVYTSPTRLLRTVSRSIEARIAAIVSKLRESGSGSARLFIFIDDLDRLDPRIALELIEGMKNFAAYENCVFILAVDQKIVERGLKAKYGSEFSDEMAQHFFDKIIQLPFSLPVNAYKLGDYVLSLLKNSSMTQDEETDRALAGRFAELLRKFGLRNPRTIKRSFNMLQMYQCMNGGEAGVLSVEKNYRQYAVLLLLLMSEEEHARMAQMVDSACTYSNDAELLQIERQFRSLRADEADPESVSPYTEAILDAFYADDGPDPTATKDLIDALTFTRSDETDPINYASAKFVLELFRRLESCPENAESLASCTEWQEIREHMSTTMALARNGRDMRIWLDGLAGGGRLMLSRFPNHASPAKRFFLSVYSGALTDALRERLGCFCVLAENEAPRAGARENIDCYWISGSRATLFPAGLRNMDRVFALLEACGFFGARA